MYNFLCVKLCNKFGMTPLGDEMKPEV